MRMDDRGPATGQAYGNENSGRRSRLGYVGGTSAKPLLGITIGDKSDETAERFADNETLVVRDQEVRLTYRQLQQKVNQPAKGLMQLGFRKGQRIGIRSPNNYEWWATQFATNKIGVIPVNINPAYRLRELEYVLSRSGCKAIVIAPRFKTSNYTQMLYDLCPELHQCKPGKLESASVPELTTIIRIGSEPSPGMFTWDEVMALGEKVKEDKLTARQNELEFDEPVNIQYTSGTTAFPRGATLSHHNILNNGYFVAELQGITEKDRI